MRARTLLLAAAVAISGCAASDDLSARAARDLDAHVAAVRDAAEATDPNAATAELEELRGAVQHWLDTGDLDPDRARAILDAADDVAAALALLPAPEDEAPLEDPVEEPDAVEEDDEAEDVDDDEDEDEAEEDEDEGENGDSSGPGGGGNSGPG